MQTLTVRLLQTPILQISLITTVVTSPQILLKTIILMAAIATTAVVVRATGLL
jgi:hypothetical protein